MKHTPITKFDGQFSFLSNFSPHPVRLADQTWPTVEHAFQGLKTLDLDEREAIRRAPTPGKAKRMGRKVTLRADWEDVKVRVMEGLIVRKFGSDDGLMMALLMTYPRELVEGNYWGDTFWGVCNGEGRNELGKILMRIRQRVMDTHKHL